MAAEVAVAVFPVGVAGVSAGGVAVEVLVSVGVPVSVGVHVSVGGVVTGELQPEESLQDQLRSVLWRLFLPLWP